jgi:hypothetical protein
VRHENGPVAGGAATRAGFQRTGSSFDYHAPSKPPIGDLRQRAAHEYLAVLRSTRLADLKPLIAVGVGWQAITDAVPAYCSNVKVTSSTFEFVEDGGSAFVLPVRVETPLTPEASDPAQAIRDGWIVDLVAFHPAHPSRWALRRGTAEWLGAVEPQYLDSEPVPVWRTPLAWLEAGCRGLVLLSREHTSQYRVLSGLGEVVAEDTWHAAELRQTLARPWPIPQVISFQKEARDAA